MQERRLCQINSTKVNNMRFIFNTKPVLAIAIATAIEEMVAKDAGVFSADELDELERIAKSIERQSQET